MDDYSKYPEVEIVTSTNASETTAKMEKIMATHGLIKELRINNGPPFQGQEWVEYRQAKNTKHRKITPPVAASEWGSGAFHADIT